MSLTKVSYSMITGAPVNVMDFGAVGNGVADDTAAIQAAINYAAAQTVPPTVIFPAGTYKTTASLTITTSYITLQGAGSRVVLSYTGSGAAILVGAGIGTTNDFLIDVSIQNFKIQLVPSSTAGLYVWLVSGGYFKNISITGSLWSNTNYSFQNGTGNCLLRVAGTINTVFELIDCNGVGPVPDVTTWCNFGLAIGAAGGGSVITSIVTTTVFKSCYFHYCMTGAWISTLVNFEDCIFEASRTGATPATDATVQFNRCYWEAIDTTDINFQGSNAVYLQNCRFVVYAGRPSSQFFAGGSLHELMITQTAFTMSGTATPRLFNAPGTSNIFDALRTVPSRMTFDKNNLQTGFTVGYIYNGTSNLIQVEDMRKTTYRFYQTGVAASSTITAFQTEFGSLKYVLPEAGHLISVHAWTTNAITGGLFNTIPTINGTAVVPFSGAITNSTTQPTFFRVAPYDVRVAANDVLTLYVATDASWAPVNDITVEVVIAHGPDGIF